MTIDIDTWRVSLICIAALNVGLWSWSALVLDRRASALPGDTHRLRRLQLVLSAVYVAGCAFRSAFPVYDVPRICLADGWLSSVAMGRSVATIAELCFVGQWALLLHEAARVAESSLARFASLAVVPLIALAEICSWYAVLTTANVGHVAEETLWGLSVAMLVVALLDLYPRCTARGRSLLAAFIVAGSVYVAFMFTVDVPMYWSRWLADEAVGRHYMTIAQGLHDVATRRVVSHRWQDWRSEILWMSLYFSLAVWMSLSFIHAPEPAAHIAGARARLRRAAVAARA